MVRRSRYPWGGASAVSTQASALALQGKWEEAADTINMLAEPGRIFVEPGPAVQFIAWIYQQLLQAYSQSIFGDMGQVATTLIALGGTDVQALAGFCALIEIADISSDASLAASLHQPLSRAFEEGIVFSSGWLFLIPRILGVGATLNGWWDSAETYFSVAIDIAMRTGAQPELGRSYLDYARMLARRSKENDQSKARVLVTQAQAIFTTFELTPFIERACAFADSLQASLEPQRSLRQSVSSEIVSESEVTAFQAITNGRYEQVVANVKVPVPQEVIREENDLSDQTSRSITIATTTEIHEIDIAQGDHLLTSQSSPQVLLFSNVVDSATLSKRLGTEKIAEIKQVHSIFSRMALRTYNGKELQHTGNGSIASFASCNNAIDCAIAMQKAFAKYNQEHPDTVVQIGIVLVMSESSNPLEEVTEIVDNTATSVWSLAQGGEILIAGEIRQLITRKDVTLVNRGLCGMRGSANPFWLHVVHQ